MKRAPDPDVVAAGAVVLRDGAVLLVHRPKYDDWSFPKGKQDPGEHVAATAVREVVEETGVEVRLGRPLTSQLYRLDDGSRDGRLKVVHYWVGRVVGDADVSTYRANAEIDGVRWVPWRKARRLLTHDMDRDVLAEALADPEPTVPLVVLRHAKASSRKRWKGSDDRARPLTCAGQAQARALVPVLAAYAVTRVLTSSSTRCADTVLPYAHEYVLGLRATPRLSEESATEKRVRTIVRGVLANPEATVVCSHRPVLPWLLDALGVECPPLAIGEMLVAHHRDGQVLALELHRPDVGP